MKGSKNSVKMSNDKMMICGVIVVLIIVGLYFLCEKNNLFNLGNVENFESAPMELNNIISRVNPKKDEVLFIFFYADWCPHCVSSKPEWSKLVKAHNNTKVNGKKIKVQSCNCQGSDAEKETAEDNNIEGYPTIKLLKDGDVISFDAKPERETLEQFLQTVLSN